MENFRNFIENLANENKNIVLKINNQNWNDIFDYMNECNVNGLNDLDSDYIKEYFESINIPTIIEKDDIFDLIDEYHLVNVNRENYTNLNLISYYLDSIELNFAKVEIKADCIRINFRTNEKGSFWYLVFKSEIIISDRKIKRLFNEFNSDTYTKIERKNNLIFVQVEA